jgi:hypothetical protein
MSDDLRKELLIVHRQALRLVKAFSNTHIPKMKDRSDVAVFLRRMQSVHNTAISIWDRFDTIVNKISNQTGEDYDPNDL